MNNERSKKNKDNNIDKAKLWNVFESEVVNPDKQKDPLECLYRTIGNRENCERCLYSLAYAEGFLTCTNNKCGIIYKDMLDQSPEWRYYGADDNQASDPTRCGMPVWANHLMKCEKLDDILSGNLCHIKKNHNMTIFNESQFMLIMLAYLRRS